MCPVTNEIFDPNELICAIFSSRMIVGPRELQLRTDAGMMKASDSYGEPRRSLPTAIETLELPARASQSALLSIESIMDESSRRDDCPLLQLAIAANYQWHLHKAQLLAKMASPLISN
ncbi:hypothetical protein XH83_38150 (plasmid) [Bradyrhizobium sp. CCBAU 53351]|nr:hypothetical protein X265_37845 [Bradyrhizobium guangdongense]QAU50896.1 hypothetical protein XH91_37045 [Bradyrhizobium guangzhouense]QOZ49515.1 hypothetical protein XH89_39215 [Bradyrhizobium sp. CCBAU 53340]QOZ81274.1 hypothetical protein XH83_38150 [Bradyrhizobium sp. CCBAU 53351]QOZ64621.1 hypothetical protein XH86_38930 [Bradyrhizobium guangdongense]